MILEKIKTIDGVIDADDSYQENVEKKLFLQIQREKFLDPIEVLSAEEKISEIWKYVFNLNYKKIASDNLSEDFVLGGWISKFTQSQIPNAEMLEWQSNTLQRILSLKPKNILEIGCGTGLLLWKLLPFLESYAGVDPSMEAINKISEKIKKDQIKNTSVNVGGAILSSEFTDLKNIDVVVINSVIQYFPGLLYLQQVINRYLKISKIKLFIGDIKSYAHNELLLISSLSNLINPSSDVSILLKKFEVLKSKFDPELSVDPQYFFDLLISNGVQRVLETQLKEESFNNEMSLYRYDVIFHEEDDSINVGPDKSFEFTEYEDIEKILSSDLNSSIEFKALTNSRLSIPKWIYENLQSFKGTINDLLVAANCQKNNGIDPKILYQLARKHNRRLRLIWSKYDLSKFHALFEVSNSKSINWFPDREVKNFKLSNDPVGKYLDPIVVNKLTKLPEFKYYIENNFKIELVDSISKS